MRGIPEVPLGLDPQHRRFLTDLRQVVLDLRDQQSPPSIPSNFSVTPEPFGNLLQWTRATNSDFTEVLWSDSPDITKAVVVPVGDAQGWFDHIGQKNITRYYWVRAARNTGPRSNPTATVSGTSLDSTVGVNPPTPPPPRQDPRGGGHIGQVQE